MKKYILILSALLPFFTSATNKGMVDEMAEYVYPNSTPDEPATIVYAADGASYLKLSDDQKRVERFETRTGKLMETVMDIDNTRESKLSSIDGFILSPEGSKLLVYSDAEPIYRRSTTAPYYVYEIRSRLLRPLSQNFPRQQSPIFSPDGRMVAFVADNNIYIKKIDYNTEVAVTKDGAKNCIINGVPDWTYEEEFSTTCSMTFSPDNLMLCYLSYNETEVPEYSLPIYEGACDPKKQYALYPGTYTYKYPVAGENNSRVSLHCYDVETRKITDINFADKQIEYIPRIDFGFSPERLMVVTLNRDQNRMELYSVNPRSTVARSVLVEESKAWITPCTYEDIVYSPDGFVVNSARSGYNHLYRYAYNGSLERTITSGAFDVTAYYGSDAAGNHYYQSTTGSPLDRVVSCVDRKGVVKNLSDQHGSASATFSPDMSFMSLKYSNVDTPPVYTMCTSAGKSLYTLEDNADYKARYESKLLKKEFFTFDSDGYTLNGYIIYPAGFDASRKYPVVMTQYSGPDSQSVLNQWSMSWEYCFARNGYIVACVDGRGTGGRGRDFATVVYKNLGYYETIDQVNAAKYLSSKPFVDASKIGMYGWSFGGYETLMCASALRSPFAAAVAVAPVTSWRLYDSVYTERYMLTPQQNEDGYNVSAPLGKVKNVECPLLIMYGTSDDNVHPANSLEYVSALQNNGILCDMLVFPNMNHSIYGCNSRAMVYANMLRFFNQNLKK